MLRALVIFFCGFMVSVAQERTTKETKIVVVINTDDHKVSHVQLLNAFQKKDQKHIFKTYPKHSFFYGILKGKYELQNEKVLPSIGATIVVHTERQLFPEQHFYADSEVTSGDTFSLGKIKTEVVTTKKGELVLVRKKE